MSTNEIATLAGGCFWCLEAVFDELKGVESVVSGYSGGHLPNPTYRQVCSETTGHAESVQLTFDPTVITYKDILKIFFAIHDPTTLNRQGNDLGTSYRSAIFYTSDEQRRIAEDTIADVEASHLWPGKGVTVVARAGVFGEAGPDLRDCLDHDPEGTPCHFIRPNWKLPRRAAAVGE